MPRSLDLKVTAREWRVILRGLELLLKADLTDSEVDAIGALIAKAQLASKR